MPTGLTCGAAANASELKCIGGSEKWDGGFVTIYILIAVLFVGSCVLGYILYRRSLPNHCCDPFHHPKVEGALASPVVLLIFRGTFFLFFLIVEIKQVADVGFDVYQAYTVWNFTFQIITLGLGTQVALHLVHGSKVYFCGSERYLRFVERLHMVCLEITFPLSILVAIVVWCVRARMR